MLGFDALSAYALSELLTDGVTGAGALTVDFTITGTVAHGVAGAGAFTVEVVVDGAGEYQSLIAEGDGAITVEFAVVGDAAHGVAGAGTVAVEITVGGAAAHGVAASGAVDVGFSAQGSAVHGIAGAGAITVALDAAGSATHLRYEVRGQVKQSGVLVNRRVRVYRRDTGALVGDADTVAGVFHVHTGFDEGEHYVVPVNLAADATDWTPPVANRVVPVLAQDA